MALRLYGHQSKIEPGKQDCNDTKLEVPLVPVMAMQSARKWNPCAASAPHPLHARWKKPPGISPTIRPATSLSSSPTREWSPRRGSMCGASPTGKRNLPQTIHHRIGIEEAGKYSLKCVGNYYDAGSPEMFDAYWRWWLTKPYMPPPRNCSFLPTTASPWKPTSPLPSP